MKEAELKTDQQGHIKRHKQQKEIDQIISKMEGAHLKKSIYICLKLKCF